MSDLTVIFESKDKIKSLKVTKTLSYVLITSFDLQTLNLVFKCEYLHGICESLMGVWFGTLGTKACQCPTGNFDYLAMLR